VWPSDEPHPQVWASMHGGRVPGACVQCEIRKIEVYDIDFSVFTPVA
jgi:hypothetical protein